MGPHRRPTDVAARPFEGTGVTRRIAPFVLAAVLAYLAVPFVRVGDDVWDLVAAGILLAGVIASVYVVPWARLPAWAQAVPPALIFVVVALLRNDTGGQHSEFTALLALPLIWFCLHGTRAQLFGGIVAVAAAITLPAIVIGGEDYPSPEIARGVLTALIAGTLAFAVQRLVEAVRGAEAETSAILANAREAEERFRRAFDDAGIGMALTGPDGEFLRVNGALAEMTGYPEEHLTGLSCGEITHPEDAPRAAEAIGDLAAGRRSRFRTEQRYLHADGRIVWIDLNMTAVHGQDGEPIYLIAQMQDISERKGAEEKLAYQASHDPLTGLPNRILLADRMEVALARLRRVELPLAVLFCDLDRFKLVNDSFGHDAGDRLLLEASQRIRGVVRPSDTLARFGGDEFAILCEEISPDGAATLATRVGEVLAVPFGIEGREVVITSSIGISINRDPDIAPGTLLANADAAMYEAKMRGRSRYAFFATEMRTRSSTRLELETDLRAAVGGGHLKIHYQPQFELDSDRIIGVEAFARWDHPERGLLDASEFIPVAEESDLVVAVGAFIIEQAAVQALRWRDEIAPDLRMTVNVSAREIGGPELAGTVAEALIRTGLPAAALCIEMTESAVSEDVEGAVEAMRDLKDLGVTISVDEFGIGTSTIGLLRRVPELDSLKIDPLFVAGLGSPGSRADLVGVIVGIARTMGMVAVAEGVESENQVAALRELGCDAAQGHHLGGPAPPDEVEALLRARASRS